MNIIYQSLNYQPDRVTGRYVRCSGRRGSYVFRIYETATGTGRFAGKPGHGPTLREYDCDGSSIPETIRDEAIRTKQTIGWPL